MFQATVQDPATAPAGAAAADQSAQSGPAWLAGLETLGWIDLTALAVLVVFLVLGLFRGLVWQLGRIASLLLSYIAAGIWGAPLGVEIRGWFSESVDQRLPIYVGSFLVFLGVLVLVSLLTWLLQKLVHSTGLRVYDRVGGGLLGVATGALVVLAFLSGAFMADSVWGLGTGVVQAAEKSHSLQVGHRVLQVAETVLPEDWRKVPQEWRILLKDEQIEARKDGLGGIPREASFRDAPPPADGGDAR